MNALAIIGGVLGIVGILGLSGAFRSPVDCTNFSLKHLKEVFPDIIGWGASDQAKYADHVCQQAIIDANIGDIIARNSLRTSMKIAADNPAFDQWNTTSVGNMAYVYLNSQDPETKASAEIILQKGYRHFKQKQAA